MYKKPFRLSIIVTLCSMLSLFSHVMFVDGAWWDETVERYESHDKKNPPKKGAILFIGGKEIARWITLEKDFAFADVINRGIGYYQGTEISDWLALTDRLVIRYHPRLIVLYAGGSDIYKGHKSPERILQDFQAFVSKVRQSLPGTTTAYISIKPTIGRSQLLKQVQQTNILIQVYIQNNKELEYIDVFTPMIGADGKPLKDLFAPDGVRLSQNGYKLWTRIIKPYLKPFARRDSD